MGREDVASRQGLAATCGHRDLKWLDAGNAIDCIFEESSVLHSAHRHNRSRVLLCTAWQIVARCEIEARIAMRIEPLARFGAMHSPQNEHSLDALQAMSRMVGIEPRLEKPMA